VGGVGDLDTAGRVGFKFREGFVDNDRHITSISQDVVVDKPGELGVIDFGGAPDRNR
jgi:hypothetical protein